MKFFTSKVLSNLKLNEKFCHLTFQLESSSGFTFKPGQFVILKVKEKVFRDYSIFSLPEELPRWEILLDVTPNGSGCRFLSKLKKGDKVETSAPLGTFFINNRKSESFILVATGCGFASTKSMAQGLLKNRKNKVCLLWGLRHQRDIFPHDIDKVEVVLSRPGKNWVGKTGHVTDHLGPLLQKFPIKRTEIYICGNGTMIADVSRLLQNYGVPSKNIHFEQYYSGREIA